MRRFSSSSSVLRELRGSARALEVHGGLIISSVRGVKSPEVVRVRGRDGE